MFLLTKNRRAQLGKAGEVAVREYLVRKGWRVIGSNLRITQTEIDLLLKKAGVLLIVEVKTVYSRSMPTQPVRFAQRKRLLAARRSLQSQTGSDVQIITAMVRPASGKSGGWMIQLQPFILHNLEDS